MSTRDAKCKKKKQYHYVAPNAYQAAFVADHYDAEQVAPTRAAVVDVCAGPQSATYAMDMMGIRSVPLDERTEVDTGWGKVRNERLELNLGFEGDPDTSTYEHMRDMYHAKGVALGRLTALFFSPNCKPNCMESRKTNKYRDKQHAPLPGVDGDLARSGDEQLLDTFLAIKRILDERAALLRERNGHGLIGKDAHGDAYDAPTDDGEDDDEEPAERTDGELGSEAEAPSEHHPRDDDASTPLVAVSGRGDCDQRSDQQGDVLPFAHALDRLCPTEGYNRRRRRFCEPVGGRNCWRVSRFAAAVSAPEAATTQRAATKTSTVLWARSKTTR